MQSATVFQPYGFDTHNIPRIKVQGKLQSRLLLGEINTIRGINLWTSVGFST